MNTLTAINRIMRTLQIEPIASFTPGTDLFADRAKTALDESLANIMAVANVWRVAAATHRFALTSYTGAPRPDEVYSQASSLATCTLIGVNEMGVYVRQETGTLVNSQALTGVESGAVLTVGAATAMPVLAVSAWTVDLLPTQLAEYVVEHAAHQYQLDYKRGTTEASVGAQRVLQAKVLAEQEDQHMAQVSWRTTRTWIEQSTNRQYLEVEE
jgi:hypothetical protein